MDALAGLDTGRGQAVAVIGEPGVGKSRRARRFLRRREKSSGFNSAASRTRPTMRMRRMPSSCGGSSTRPIRTLVSRPGRAAVKDLEPEAFRRGLHQAFRAWLTSDLLAKEPVVLAIEDIHWIDASSLDLTADLAQLANGTAAPGRRDDR